MISATIFYNKGMIASTSQGKIIHILNKIDMKSSDGTYLEEELKTKGNIKKFRQ